MSAQPPSWHATGLVEKAWKRISPPTREELARRMEVEGADLSARNTSTSAKPRSKQRRMTVDYAQRIVAAVRQEDPTFSVADLGAPSSVVVVVDPTVLDRLQALEVEVAWLRGWVNRGFEALGVAPELRGEAPPPRAEGAPG